MDKKEYIVPEVVLLQIDPDLPNASQEGGEGEIDKN